MVNVNVNVRTLPGCSKGRLSCYQVLPHFKSSGQLFRVFADGTGGINAADKQFPGVIPQS
ncbi:hypothetical protein MOOR_10030 [Moorella thermoacetica]|uniref:Uncharacterized protein n=1 Tax=Neomoorella thermoacetica TaxID=1525 RepID=A0A1J5JJA9_NEOTH|nr:hypothetical protein MOOR_10030 [Moorella thermoacetica]